MQHLWWASSQETNPHGEKWGSDEEREGSLGDSCSPSGTLCSTAIMCGGLIRPFAESDFISRLGIKATSTVSSVPRTRRTDLDLQLPRIAMPLPFPAEPLHSWNTPRDWKEHPFWNRWSVTALMRALKCSWLEFNSPWNAAGLLWNVPWKSMCKGWGD